MEMLFSQFQVTIIYRIFNHGYKSKLIYNILLYLLKGHICTEVSRSINGPLSLKVNQKKSLIVWLKLRENIVGRLQDQPRPQCEDRAEHHPTKSSSSPPGCVLDNIAHIMQGLTSWAYSLQPYITQTFSTSTNEQNQ